MNKRCFCETEDIFIKQEFLKDHPFFDDIKHKSAFTVEMGILIDVRNGCGYLRLVDTDDYNCIEAGQNVKISFCPFCGKEFLKHKE